MATLPPVDRTRATRAMDRYAMGDAAAFDELYEALVPPLRAFARARDEARHEDLVQQTLLQLHVARSSYRPGADVLSWAFAILHRLAIDGFRQRRREVVAEDPHMGATPTSEASSPENAVVTGQLSRLAQAALADMPDNVRDAFVLVREHGLSSAEAAEVLGTTRNAVNLRVHRANEALRAALAVE